MEATEHKTEVTCAELLAALKELVLLPNKHRPDRVWADARAAIAKAERTN